MPFSRDGAWTTPVETDHTDFHNKIMSKRQEIAPTKEMIDAIAQQLPKGIESIRTDVFSTIGKLKGPVDIVIPVYGGLHVLKPCIDSIVKHTQWDYRLIIVDDCSTDPEVKKYLDELQERQAVTEVFEQTDESGGAWLHKVDVTVLYNRKNRGFAPTVNRGVAEGRNPYICILNSDTLVTKGWLVRQLMALETDKKNVIVNPVTNNTAMINVQMYSGCSYRDMADALAIAPNTLTYNEIMPTGFCFTMRRKLWAEVGPFDEAYISYGEESDFWFKAIHQTDENGVILRNRSVIADNAYVFHERGTSFSQLDEDEHMAFRQSGSKRFKTLHPGFRSWNQGFSADRAIGHLRNDLPRSAFRKKFKGNIAWVVKSAGMCGGMNFIADIVNELIEQGYNAKVCVVPDNYNEDKPNLQVVGSLHTAPILFTSHDEFTSTFKQRVFAGPGKVFAAVTELAPIVWDLDQSYPDIEGFNHVQSYDPELARILGKEEACDAFKESYRRLPNLCSSQWVADEIKELGGEICRIVLPGVNPDLFHPRDRNQGDERFTVAILYNEMYTFKGAKWAKEFLKALSPEKQTHMRVIAIGPEALDIRGVTCIGEVTQARMADLLGNEIDVLVDPSELHSYGMPALEALVSGCRVICRPNKGINEIEPSWNERVAVTDDPKAAAQVLVDIVKVPSSRDVELTLEVNRFERVQEFIDWAFPPLCKDRHKIEVITPHLRKHGGPTTIIEMAKQIQVLHHEVSMSTIYSDWNPEVLNAASGLNVRTTWKEVPEGVEAVIINSDNPFAEELMSLWPDKKFIMLKLSHNPRFQATENSNLNLPWDHIMTSTEWLRQACINPMTDVKGWDHAPWDEGKVTTVGWYHYGHDTFNKPPTEHNYGNATAGFRVGMLIHDHATKGSKHSMAAIEGLKKKYEALVHGVGFGEVECNVPWHMQYVKNANREDMSYAFKQLDVWLGASHSEGLGRMALEAMSAGVAVVTTDTGAEFLKDGENCLLYAPGDSQGSAELVDKLVNDKELFIKLVLGGHATAVAAADPSDYRANLNMVIRKVLEQ